MELKEALDRWRTHIPKIYENDKADSPFSIQYRLVSLGETERLRGLSADKLDEERETRPNLKAHIEDKDWARLPKRIKEVYLMLDDRLGTVEGLTLDGKRIGNFFALLDVIVASHGQQLMREMDGMIHTAYVLDDEDAKKNSGA